MAARSRDAIFELVVLKEKPDQKKGEAQTYQNTGIFRNGLTAEVDDCSSQHESERDGAGVDATGGDTSQTDSGGHEERRILPGSPQKIESFDNATYSASYFKNNDTTKPTEKQPTDPRRWPVVLFLSVTVLILITILVIGSISLASVNNTKLTKLEQTVVNNMSYQMANAGFLAMFDSLQTQVEQLNQSIQKLSENLAQISMQVNMTNLALTELRDSTEIETEALAGRTNQLNSTLASQASQIEELRGDLMDFNSMLNNTTASLNASLEQAISDIGTLETQISQPVDVFKNCTSTVVNSTDVFLFSDSELMYGIFTAPVNATSDYVSDVHCQIQSDNTENDLIQSAHLQLDSAGRVFCQCTALLPLSINGTHELPDEDFSTSILCQLVRTSCSREQQLFRLN